MSRAMSRNAICLLAVFAATPVLFADEKSEWKALNGSWKVEKAILMGSDATEALGAVTLTMNDGTYTVTFGKNLDKGTLKLEPKARPKRVSITSTEGPNKGKTLEGIYETDGDTLKICYALEGKDPPKAFESKEKTQTLYILYTRDRAKGK